MVGRHSPTRDPQAGTPGTPGTPGNVGCGELVPPYGAPRQTIEPSARVA